MRFNMMALKVSGSEAFFTVAAFFHDFCNHAPTGMDPITNASSPVWMISAGVKPPTPDVAAFIRTIISRTTMPLAEGKDFSACFASVRYPSYAWTGPYFARALARTGVCFSSIMSAKYREFFSAYRADERYFTSSLNFSRSI